MQTPPANLYEFGGFEFDPAKRLLRRLDGTRVPLTPRVFDTLLYMVEHHDAVMDKERIMEAVWPDSIVEENNLAQAISRLRQIFGETPGSHSYIVTVPGRGYRFVAEVFKGSAGRSRWHCEGGARDHGEASIRKASLKAAGDQVGRTIPTFCSRCRCPTTPERSQMRRGCLYRQKSFRSCPLRRLL